MVRKLRIALPLLLLAALGVVQAQDATIYFKDRAAKKDAEIVGTIEEEGFLGVKIKSSKTKDTKFIPAADIDRVVYKEDAKVVGSIDYGAPFRKEGKAIEANENLRALKEPDPVKEEKARTRLEKLRTDLLDEALTGYAKVEKEVKTPAARRYFQFKQVEVRVHQAKFNPAKMEAAVKALTEFKKDHREGWQLLIALDTLAKIHEDAGRIEEARKAYEELAELPGAPESVKQQSGVLVGKLLLRGKQFKEAEARLDKVVSTMSGADLQKPLAQAYLYESRLGLDKMQNTKEVAAL